MTAGVPQRQQVRRRMEQAARVLSLPFRSQHWRGLGGNWLGAGTGSSFDYQDHRPYLPGDDPRYIDWSAYARTGNYIMKLYREEVSPTVDLVMDGSRSLFFDNDKQLRTLELFYFCAESALQSGAPLRAFVVNGHDHCMLRNEELAGGLFPEFPDTIEDTPAPALGKVPWRPGSLRVLISDLLFPGSPDALLRTLVHAKGRGVVLAPYTAAEAGPDWNGNLQLVDCESRQTRLQRVSPDLLERYNASYLRHFELWKESCRRYAILMSRVAATVPFQAAMLAEAVPGGVVKVRD